MRNQNDAPSISVIVAVYNIEGYIEKCVRTIMEQTYHNLEIILVDDGSTDRSADIIDQLATQDNRIIVIHKKNGGLSDARNAGIERATGEYLAFVDGDDWIDTTMYADIMKAILESKADIGICRYRQIYPDRCIDESSGTQLVLEGKEALSRFIKEEDCVQIQNAAWNKVYKSELLGEQRFPIGKWYEDIVFTTILLSKVNRCVYLDTAYYNYVLEREGSIMSKGINSRILTDQIPAYLEKGDFLRSIKEDHLAAIHEYFFVKRMLLYYLSFAKSKDKDRRVYCIELKKVIQSRRNYMAESYQWEDASRNEQIKMELFHMSPFIFRTFMLVNDAIILPFKIYLKRITKRK